MTTVSEPHITDDPSTGLQPSASSPASADLPPVSFVLFLQNHDQIGNRKTGDRLSASLTDGQLAIAAVLG
mgnify:CR=1 FL=1